MWNRCHYEPDNPAPVFQGRTAKIVTRVGKLQHCDMEQRPPNVVYKADRLSIDQRFGLTNMSARRGDRGEAPAMANGSHVAGGREALEYPPHSLMHGDCSGRARGEDAEANPASIDINRPFAIDTRGMSPNYDNSILWAHQSRPRDVSLHPPVSLARARHDRSRLPTSAWTLTLMYLSHLSRPDSIGLCFGYFRPVVQS